MLGYPKVEKKSPIAAGLASPFICIQNGPGAPVAFCTKPSTASATPFQTIKFRTSRLPRRTRQCFTATMAGRAVANQSTTLRWSSLFTQYGSIGTGGLGLSPDAIATLSQMAQRPLFVKGTSSRMRKPRATHTSGSRFMSCHTRSRASYVVS